MIETFESKVTSITHLTEDVIKLTLTVPGTFTFKAGQYAMLKVENNGVSKLRAYSILNPPSEKGHLDFAIKLVEGGHASEAFKRMKVDDVLQVKAPFGHFVYKETSNSRACFIATGTGVAPFHSMIKEHLNEKKLRLIFGVRYKKGLFLHEEFKSWESDNFEYWPTLTREEWDGKTGRVQTHLTDDLQDTDFYICGLKEMVLQTKQHLLDKGVKEENIYFERFS